MTDRRDEIKHEGESVSPGAGFSKESPPAGDSVMSSELGAASERRVKRMAERKRQVRKRLAGGAGVLLLAILVAVVAPILLSDDVGADRASGQIGSTVPTVAPSASVGAEDSQNGQPAQQEAEEASPVGASGPSTTYLAAVGVSDEVDTSSNPPITSPVRLASGPTSPGAAIFVTDSGALATVVVLQPVEQGGVSLGIPAKTVVRTAQGFETIARLHSAGDTDALISGLGTILGLAPISGGATEVSALERVLSGQEDVPAGDVVQGDSRVARRYAQAVLDLAHLAAGRERMWNEVIAGVDASIALEIFTGTAAAEADRDWQAAVLPGKRVNAPESPYYDTDMNAARQLVSHILALGGTDVVLAVQNGSGAVGAAEAAAASLAVMGCKTLPFANAPGFPDVEATAISAAPGARAAAHQVQALLGMGTVTEDESLAPGNVVVVVGKDLDMSSAQISAAFGHLFLGRG